MIALSLAAALLAGPGYVVRADADKVYLDLGQGSASVGAPFVIYKEGEELKHPVSGKSLGAIELKIAEGTIEEVHEQYSVGKLKAAAGVEPGQRVRLGAAPAPAPAPAPAASAEPGSKAPKWRSDAFDFEITAMAVADLDGDGKTDTALSDGRSVIGYGYPPKPAEKGAAHKIEVNALRLYSLEAADLNGNGKAEVFASFFNDTFQRFETLILELADGKWTKLGELSAVVRSHQEGDGSRVLAMQRIVDDKTFPYSTIYPLVYENGKYAAGKPAVRLKRVEWIYDFTKANLDGVKPAVISLTGTELLRVQFDKGQWKTSESYGQTPLRVRWADRVLSFRPAMPARYDGGRFAGLYVVRNKAALGGLAQPFGLFTGGELVRKDWNGVSLSDAWRGPLGGYASAVSLADGEVAVAVVGTAGRSSIWAFEP